MTFIFTQVLLLLVPELQARFLVIRHAQAQNCIELGIKLQKREKNYFPILSCCSCPTVHMMDGLMGKIDRQKDTHKCILRYCSSITQDTQSTHPFTGTGSHRVAPSHFTHVHVIIIMLINIRLSQSCAGTCIWTPITVTFA